MSYRRIPFAPDEYYHCYTRGIDGRITFTDKEDYERFQEYLYLCNDTGAFDRNNFSKHTHAEIFSRPRRSELVGIGFYSLMPNHFHIGFREIAEGGSSKFLQKLGTSYSMYFNSKYGRVGGLFIGPCRSKHIGDDRYFRRVAQYVHLNAAELYAKKWKQGIVKDTRLLEKQLRNYPYASLRDYTEILRPEHSILNAEARDLVLGSISITKTMLEDAREYYAGPDHFHTDIEQKRED